MKAKSTLDVRPDISYRKALSGRFTLDQTTYTVADCPSDVFKRFIEGCGQAPDTGRSWNLAQLGKLLSLLDQDCSTVARWYAIDVLLEHKVKVPLETGEGRPAIGTL
jgi:hypothetical protein